MSVLLVLSNFWFPKTLLDFELLHLMQSVLEELLLLLVIINIFLPGILVPEIELILVCVDEVLDLLLGLGLHQFIGDWIIYLLQVKHLHHVSFHLWEISSPVNGVEVVDVDPLLLAAQQGRVQGLREAIGLRLAQ